MIQSIEQFFLTVQQIDASNDFRKHFSVSFLPGHGMTFENGENQLK
jgi:hypothetical protein